MSEVTTTTTATDAATTATTTDTPAVTQLLLKQVGQSCYNSG